MKEKKCLLIVDLQEDFLPPKGSLAVSGGRDIIEVINQLIKNVQWDLIVCSKDWHPKQHISFASSHPGAVAFKSKITIFHPTSTKNNGYNENLWPDHCIKNTKGACFPEEFDLIDIKDNTSGTKNSPNKIIYKGTKQYSEQYSAFSDVWNIENSDLDEYLKKNNIIKLYVCGLALDICVMESAIDGARLGYKTYVIIDASKSVDQSVEGLNNCKRKLSVNNITSIYAGEISPI